ncbi:Putative BTB/POZ domain-containing protein [Colletotrichum destructivum]|uniref:BTB/POZ domain-containing protein n=1 Tax=Colletotrichum destructivum TaxID=34406 RepID=A0AAX4HYP5_9PEZI|nr:Putative BTB/POZ domain-containing protein [Colletotrichum destructivum]
MDGALSKHMPMDKPAAAAPERFFEVRSPASFAARMWSRKYSGVPVVPDGDLILVVGLGAETTELRADSLILKRASRVFGAMLGPRFSEGQKLLDRGAEPVKISLPDEDPEIMELILNILHHQNSRVCQIAAADSILEVAVIADKYDLVDALKVWIPGDTKATRNHRADHSKYASQTMLRYHEPSIEHLTVGDLWRLGLAAGLLNEPKAFEKITRMLVWNHTVPYIQLADAEDAIDIEFALRMCYLLEKERQDLKTSLLLHLLPIISTGNQLRLVEIKVDSAEHFDAWPELMKLFGASLKETTRFAEGLVLADRSRRAAGPGSDFMRHFRTRGGIRLADARRGRG